VVTFKDAHAATEVLSHGIEIEGWPLYLREAEDRGERGGAVFSERDQWSSYHTEWESGNEVDPGKSIFFANVPFVSREIDLKRRFASVGVINSFHLFKRQDGSSRGMGVVEYVTTAAARRAVNALSESNIDGRYVLIQPYNRQYYSAYCASHLTELRYSSESEWLEHRELDLRSSSDYVGCLDQHTSPQDLVSLKTTSSWAEWLVGDEKPMGPVHMRRVSNASEVGLVSFLTPAVANSARGVECKKMRTAESAAGDREQPFGFMSSATLLHSSLRREALVAQAACIPVDLPSPHGQHAQMKSGLSQARNGFVDSPTEVDVDASIIALEATFSQQLQAARSPNKEGEPLRARHDSPTLDEIEEFEIEEVIGPRVDAVPSVQSQLEVPASPSVSPTSPPKSPPSRLFSGVTTPK
ncbi:mrd1, partial [Symbiodinium necroappetens]